MKYQNCVLRLIPCLLMQAIVVMPLSSMLVAQQPVPVGAYEVQAEGPVPAAGIALPSKEKIGGAKQYQLLNLYAIEIGRIDAAAKLDDAQKSKLNVGAKGIAKEKAQVFAQNMDPMMDGAVLPIGVVPASPAKPKLDEPPLKLEKVMSYAEVDVNVKIMFENSFLPKADHREDPDWQKLVKSVLKPDQHVKYEQALAAQKQIVDKTMVDEGIANLSVDVLLSKDQESKLTALLMEQLAKPKPAAPTEDRAMAGMIVSGMQGLTFLMELAKVDSKKIRNVLDPQQFELLELKLGTCRLFAAEMAPGVIIAH